MDIKDIPLAEKYIQYLKDNGLFNVELFARNRTKLEERYFDYAGKHQQDFNQRKIENEKLEARIKTKRYMNNDF